MKWRDKNERLRKAKRGRNRNGAFVDGRRIPGTHFVRVVLGLGSLVRVRLPKDPIRLLVRSLLENLHILVSLRGGKMKVSVSVCHKKDGKRARSKVPRALSMKVDGKKEDSVKQETNKPFSSNGRLS